MQNHAVQKDIKGIYAKAVTTHSHSQKALDRIAFYPSGILLAHSPAKRFSRSENRRKQRETLILHHRKTVPTPLVQIHLPGKHGEMVQRILKRLQVPVKISSRSGNNPAQSPQQHCVMEIDIRERLDLALIMIQRYGLDFEREFQNRLRQLCLREIAVINIYLDLKDPASPEVVMLLEKTGCFFAGFLPAHPRYFLILQYLNNVNVDYDKIAVYDTFAKKLLDYVRDEDPDATPV